MLFIGKLRGRSMMISNIPNPTQIQLAVSPSLTSLTQRVRVSRRGPLFKMLSKTIKKKKMRKCGEGEIGGGGTRVLSNREIKNRRDIGVATPALFSQCCQKN